MTTTISASLAGGHPEPSVIDRAVEGVVKVLRQATPEEAEAFASTLEARGVAAGLDPALWGTSDGEPGSTADGLGNLEMQFEDRRRVELSSVTRRSAARLLGVSAQAVTEALAAGRLVGLKRGRTWFIPAWQLDGDAETGVLAGISRTAESFPGGVVALSLWMERPQADLDGSTPRRCLARGQVDRVVLLASSLTAAGW